MHTVTILPHRTRTLNLHVLRTPTATTLALRPRSTISNGARTTTSPWKLLRSGTWPQVALRPFPIRISLQTEHGLAAAPIWGPMQPHEPPPERARPVIQPRPTRPAAPQARLRPPAPLRTTPLLRPALPSCGTHTTSARLPPTIFSPAAC